MNDTPTPLTRRDFLATTAVAGAGLAMPDYPAMPSHEAPVPFPLRYPVKKV